MTWIVARCLCGILALLMVCMGGQAWADLSIDWTKQYARMNLPIAGAGVAGGCANTCSGVYGYNSIESPAEDAWAADYEMVIIEIPLACSEANPTIHGTFQDPNPGTPCNIKFIVYDTDGGSGEPGTRLYVGSSILINQTSYAEFSEAATISCMNTGGSNKIWIGTIATLGGGATCGFYYKTDAGAKMRRVTNADFNPPASWPTSTDSETTRQSQLWLSW